MKETEAALRDSEARFRSLIEGAPEAIAMSRDGLIIYANPRYLKMFGLSSEGEILGRPPLGRIAPEDRERAADFIRPYADGKGEQRETDFCGLRRDGSRFHFHVSTALVELPDGPAVVGFFTDITERKKAEEKYRVLHDTMLQGVIYRSADGKILSMNPVAERIVGKDYEGMLCGGKAGHKGCIREDGSPFPEEEHPAKVALRTGKEVKNVIMGTWDPEEGEYRWISVNAVPLFRPGEDRAYQVYTLFDDITEYKRAAEALQESEARYRELFENSMQSIVIFEPVRDEGGQMVDLTVVDANPPFEKEIGIPLEVMQGKRVTELFDMRTAGHAIEIGREVMAAGQGRHVEHFVPWNEQYYIETYFPIRDDRLAIIGLNITYRKKVEEALERSNADLQQFAYIASHDLQEPLRMVSSYLSLLERREAGNLDRCSRQYIGFAIDGARRMSAMINDLLAFSRVESKGREFSPVDMDEVLTIVLRDLKVAVEESGARVTSDRLPTVLADKGQMVQLMENLIGNAIKYRSEAAPQVHVCSQGNGREWEFSIQDNGIGIDPAYQDRLFRMFQRLHTRNEYDGTGMGLALSRRIVERHGGRIWFESEPGEGSTFRFTIPVR